MEKFLEWYEGVFNKFLDITEKVLPWIIALLVVLIIVGQIYVKNGG